MIIELLGCHGEVLKSISPPPLCESVRVREAPADDPETHFPNRSAFRDWHKPRKISNLAPADAAAR